ncbi:alpha/beta hydrolase family protein [Halorarius halobius]|uniref:alpha/beta hydrolase family protein n=1 Tax=Halorarius halobius TaxID=2962671 RepID=UPI0020CC1C1B|nr:hypothetical protein [Halorarius halobius]
MDEPTRRRLLRAAGASAAGLGLVAPASGDEAGDDANDDPAYPSPAWFERETRNYARVRQAPREQASDPAFQRRWQTQSAANLEAYLGRTRTEPGWHSEGNLCAQYAEQCTGDPYLYPAGDDYDGHPVYERAVRERVVFHDREGARLAGYVWAPDDADARHPRPAVVVTNGSVQAPQTAYWWFAATLVEAGYVVLTYDPRGQGRSDTLAGNGDPGTNVDASVFVANQVDAVDFLLSTPDEPYPHTAGRTDVPAPVRRYNPLYELVDPDRVGIVGHSAGAIGASVVQGLDPWPGALDANPVGAAVAWDNLGSVEDTNPYRYGGLVDELGQEIAPTREVEPRVPTMGQSADYFLSPKPKERPPDPDEKRQGYLRWVEAEVPTYQLVVRGGTHYEWSRIPTFPATSWDAGNALADHYSLAWLDRWLKAPDEPGYHDADERLLADERFRNRLSFYYKSSRAFPDRQGTEHRVADVRGDVA